VELAAAQLDLGSPSTTRAGLDAGPGGRFSGPSLLRSMRSSMECCLVSVSASRGRWWRRSRWPTWSAWRCSEGWPSSAGGRRFGCCEPECESPRGRGRARAVAHLAGRARRCGSFRAGRAGKRAAPLHLRRAAGTRRRSPGADLGIAEHSADDRGRARRRGIPVAARLRSVERAAGCEPRRSGLSGFTLRAGVRTRGRLSGSRCRRELRGSRPRGRGRRRG
jgi:hypothetical protein